MTNFPISWTQVSGIGTLRAAILDHGLGRTAAWRALLTRELVACAVIVPSVRDLSQLLQQEQYRGLGPYDLLAIADAVPGVRGSAPDPQLTNQVLSDAATGKRFRLKVVVLPIVDLGHRRDRKAPATIEVRRDDLAERWPFLAAQAMVT